MPLWIVSSAGSGSATHWNQPPSSSRFTRSAPSVDLHFHDDRRVRHAELLGEDDADLAEALVVGLQAGEDEVELSRRASPRRAPSATTNASAAASASAST